MIGLSIEFDPSPAVNVLDKLIDAMTDLRPLYEAEIEPAFYEWQTERFATEGGEERWERLSTQYAAWKAQNFPGRGILERTGLLKEGLTTRGGRYNVRRMDATTLELGTSAPHAQYHQHGTGRMPRRRLILPEGNHLKQWQELGEAYFERIAKDAGA